MTLKNWTARRAGGRITVTGENAEVGPAKIVGVDTIRPGAVPGCCYATDKNGTIHKLLLDPPSGGRGSIPHSHRGEGRNFVD